MTRSPGKTPPEEHLASWLRCTTRHKRNCRHFDDANESGRGSENPPPPRGSLNVKQRLGRRRRRERRRRCHDEQGQGYGRLLGDEAHRQVHRQSRSPHACQGRISEHLPVMRSIRKCVISRRRLGFKACRELVIKGSRRMFRKTGMLVLIISTICGETTLETSSPMLNR